MSEHYGWGFQTSGQAQLHDDAYGTEYARGPGPIRREERELPWEIRMEIKARLAREAEERRAEWERMTPWTEARCADPECARHEEWPGHLVVSWECPLHPTYAYPRLSHIWRPL